MRHSSNVDFDPKRLFLADLNGTGCADLVYVDLSRAFLVQPIRQPLE